MGQNRSAFDFQEEHDYKAPNWAPGTPVYALEWSDGGHTSGSIIVAKSKAAMLQTWRRVCDENGGHAYPRAYYVGTVATVSPALRKRWDDMAQAQRIRGFKDSVRWEMKQLTEAGMDWPELIKPCPETRTEEEGHWSCPTCNGFEIVVTGMTDEEFYARFKDAFDRAIRGDVGGTDKGPRRRTGRAKRG